MRIGGNQPVGDTRRHQDDRLVLVARISVVAAVLVYMASNLLHGLAEGIEEDDLAYVIAYGAVLIVFGLLGLAIVHKYAPHTIGWLFLGLTVYVPLTTIAPALARMARDERLEEWLGHWTWIPIIAVPLTFIPLLFPDGRLPTPRWRWVVAANILGTIGFLGYTMFGPYLGGSEEYGPNPYHQELVGGVSLVLGLLFVPGLIGSVSSAVVRYRRSRGVMRQQIKWPVFGALLAGLMIVFVSLSSVLVDLNSTVSNFLVILAVAMVPLSVGLGITRYRLYDIDRLISRTLAYSIVAGVLGAVYGSVVALLGLSADFGNDLSVAVSTLTAAALFQPLRRRVMRWVDRRFNRCPYDAEQVAGELRVRLRSEVGVDRIGDELAAVVKGALEPEFLAVWFAAHH